jgi:hypothetical protein
MVFEAEVGPLPWRLDFGNEQGMFAAINTAVSGPNSASRLLVPHAVDTYPISAWGDCGHNLLLGVPMIPSCAPGYGGSGFDAVAAGTYDVVFTRVAEALVANGFGAQNAMARIGWEFNGWWFPWSAKGMASKFVRAFRRIVKVLRKTIPGLPTMWNPTRGDMGAGNLGSFFPGAEYVTCAALDVYDTEWRRATVVEPLEFEHALTQPYGLAWLEDLARIEGVEAGLGEWGLFRVGQTDTATQRGGGDDPTFVNDMVVWIKSHATGPCILWDDQGSFSVNPNSLAALKAAIAKEAAKAG